MIDDFRGPSSSRKTGKIAMGGFKDPAFYKANKPGSIHVQKPASQPFRTPDQVANDASSAWAGAPVTPRHELPKPMGENESHQIRHDDDKNKGTLNPLDHENLLPPSNLKKQPKTIKLFRRWEVSKKKFIIVTSVLAVLLIGGGAAAYSVLLRDDSPAATPQVVKKSTAAPPAAKPILSPLTGLPVTEEQRNRPVTGVMIENSGDARPQSGLYEAGVVYEAIAEAGITRFLALYQEAAPGNIGPIRSSRPYYLDWAVAFDAGYAHVGGSPDALQRIKSIGVKDLDQFYNAAGYHRITTRYAPHNVYTGVNQLVDLAKSKGWETSSFTSFPRKAAKPYVKPAATAAPASGTAAKPAAASDTRTPANSINFSISGAFYNAHYDYDPPSNKYKRSEGGAPHLDMESKQQLAPNVVIALVMPYSLMADGYHSNYNTIGTGKMYVFQDGTVTTGTWTKGQPKEQFVFKDDAGKELALNPGQTWISIVADNSKVTFQ